MNYYGRHIGDYLKDAAHLSLLEHGIYARLMDVYYTRESAIPENKAARLIGAATPETLQALQDVLQEFFDLRDGHWHQDRCDEEIAIYLAGEPEREVRKVNEDNRLKRHRQERSDLFRQVVNAGRHAPWNIGIVDLRKLAEQCVAVAVACNAPETKPATATATPATATHYPLPTPHYPLPIPQRIDQEKPPAAPWLTCADLMADGLDEGIANAWLAHRRAKKAKLTRLAWDGFKAEVLRAGWDLEDALRKAIARNWIAFEAEWVRKEGRNAVPDDDALRAQNARTTAEARAKVFGTTAQGALDARG